MAAPRSVLILVESAAPRPYWIEAVRRLVEAGVRTTLASLGESGALLDACHRVGAGTHAFGATRGTDYPRVVLALAGYLLRQRPDIVHAAGPIPAALSGLAGFAARTPRRLYHRHHVLPAEHPVFGWLAARRCHIQMAVSSTAVDRAMDEGTSPAEHICLAPNGVPHSQPASRDHVRSLRDELGMGPRARVLAVVARLRAVKGVDVAIEALSDLRERVGEPIHLLVVGDGADRTMLEQQALTLGLQDCVHFVGYQDDPVPWMMLADAVLVPSRQESFGLVAVEAMALSKPVIASSVEGLRETVVDGESGLLVPADNSGALATAAQAILGDRNLSDRLARAGHRRFEEYFTIDTMVRGWLRCYERALRGPAGSR